MKALLPLLLFCTLWYLLGSILRIHMVRTYRSKKSIGVVSALVYCSPFVVFCILGFQEWWEQRQFHLDVAYVQELCARSGGDKIYRRVDNVEGVFQMTARPYTTDAIWRDQYGMQDPWGKAQGDSDSTLAGSGPSIALGPNSIGTGIHGYRFLEQRTAPGESTQPYLRRIPGKNLSTYVSDLRSRYGYQTEDITTPEMRKRWIAGGRITIVDLRTQEVLAERVGYFKAIGKKSSMPWYESGAYSTRRMCPNNSHLSKFLTSVLIPPTK